jgi:TRAP-type C4-dicarboxylate transport system permease small subunit
LKNVGTVLSKIEDTLHLLGCLGLVTVVVLINADIIMRFAFGIPVQFQFEVTELYLMPALAILPLSRVFREGGHLALELVPEHLPGRAGNVIGRVRLLLPAAFFAAVAFVSGQHAVQAFLSGDSHFGVTNWPLGWAYSLVPLGCGVLALRLLYDAVQNDPRNEHN